MIKSINDKDWFCCPVCGKKLFPITEGAVCRGVMAKCRGKLPDRSKCIWAGEVKIY